MKSSFSRFGIPEERISDNGSQYPSRGFREFAKIYNFRHTTSSPEYPQSNGLAERTIQTVKKTLKKARRCSEDPYLALLALRTTPKANSESPAFKLMKRNPRTLLPRIAKTVNKSNTDHKFSKPKEISPLQQNKNVRVLQDNLWKREGVVIRALHYRSYKIRLRNGNIPRRNRRHILPTKQLQESDDEYDPLDDNINLEEATNTEQPPDHEYQQQIPYQIRSGRTIVRPSRYR